MLQPPITSKRIDGKFFFFIKKKTKQRKQGRRKEPQLVLQPHKLPKGIGGDGLKIIKKKERIEEREPTGKEKCPFVQKKKKKNGDRWR